MKREFQSRKPENGSVWKNIVAEGPGYIGGNQQSSLTWEHRLVLSSRRNKQRGISLTKNIWISSCFILRSAHGISCSQANLHLFSYRNHWRKSMWWLPSKRIQLGKYLLLQWFSLLIIDTATATTSIMIITSKKQKNVCHCSNYVG